MSIEWEKRKTFVVVYLIIANQRRLEVTLWYARWRRHTGAWAGTMAGMPGARYWELGQVDVYYYPARHRA